MPTPTVLATAATSATTEISPDGQYMVFLDGATVYSHEIATGTTVTLSTTANPDEPPRISPDSTRAIWMEASPSLQRVSAPIGGGSVVNLDLEGLFHHFDATSDSLVFSKDTGSLPMLDLFAVPLTGGPSSPITTYDSNDTSVYTPFVDDSLDGYAITDGSSIADDVPIIARSLTGGADVPVGANGYVWQVLDDLVVYTEYASGEAFAKEMPTGTPVALDDGSGTPPSIADPMSAVSFSKSAERIAWWDGDAIWIQNLDGSARWEIDTPMVGMQPPSIFLTQFSPDGQALAYWDCTTCTTGTPTIRYAEISGNGGPLTSTTVPDGDAVAFQSAGWTFGTAPQFFGNTFLPDGRVFIRKEPAMNATTATFVLWEPGEAVSDSITLPWQASDFVGGIAVSPSGDDLLVSGDDGVIRHVTIGDKFGVPEVLETTSDLVVSAHRAGNQLFFNTVPDLNVCPFGHVGFCTSDLKVVDDPLVAGSAVTMLANPARLMDTRSVGDTPDDIAEKDGPLGSSTNNPFGNGVYRLEVAGRLGVDVDASAAVLNVTAVNPQGAGFFTVFPCNGAVPTPPLTASLNFGTGTASVGNNVTVGLDTDGDVCIYSNVISDVVVDIAGFFPDSSPFQTIVPERFADTRVGTPPAQVVTGGIVGVGNTASVSTLELDVAGLGSIPVDAVAVSMNIAAVNPVAQGFATAYPCDVPQPPTASLNFAPFVNVSNGVVIGVAQTSDPLTDGKICVVTNEETDLVIDIAGFYPANGGFIPSSPVRFLETRTGPGQVTVDGINEGAGVAAAKQQFEVQVAGRPGVPLGATAVAVNFAAIRPAAEAGTGFTSGGFLTAYPGPCGTAPLASNLNVSIGEQVKANGAVIALPPSGEICVFVDRDMDLVMDVTGYFPS